MFTFVPWEGTWRFNLLAWLPEPAEVFRLEADGPHDAEFTLEPAVIVIRDRVSMAGIYVCTPAPGLGARLQARHTDLLRFEESVGFDLARQAADLETLPRLLTAH